MIFVIICDDTHATSESIVYVFGIGELSYYPLPVHRKVIVFLRPL